MRKARYVAAAVAAAGIGLSLVGSATADESARPGDVVGVGSDTLQNIVNFVADGDTTGDAGYNTGLNPNRVFSFNATPDDNDRTLYANNGGSIQAVNPSVILRAGMNPWKRPNGSGDGLNALLSETYGGSGQGGCGTTFNSTVEPSCTIQFVRMSSMPSSANNASAVTAGWGGLHVVKIATDDLAIAVRNSTNGGTNAVPLTPFQLYHVYKCDTNFNGVDYTDWHTFNATAPVGSTIVPLHPQSGSGTGKTFSSDLSLAGTGTADNTSNWMGTCAKSVEENDPSAILNPPTGLAINAIGPMSSGRKDLFDSGYFHDPSVVGGKGSSLSSGLDLLYAAPPSTTGNNGVTSVAGQTADACIKPTDATSSTSKTYCNTRGLYIVWRASDDNSTTPFQPGTSKNWVNALFYAPTGTPYVKGFGQADIAAAGVTPSYVNCGVGPTAWSTASCT